VKNNTAPARAIRELASKRGRPRKFNGPSRAVTLTLPEEIIAALESVDSDLSRAVVRIAQGEAAKQPHSPAQLVSFGRRAVIVINPTKTLEERTGIFLIPMSDGRALISFDESLTIPDLELRVQDALEDRRLSTQDRGIFETIGGLLKTARHDDHIVLYERKIIVLETKRRPRAG
jgi:hypothetical protein